MLNFSRLLLIAGLTLNSCSKQDAPEISITTATYSAGAVQGGGSIQGVVSTSGMVAAVPEIQMNADQGACGGSSHPNPAAPAVNGSRGLSGVIVFLSKIEKGKPFDDIPNQGALDQKSCEFHPHIQIVRKGAPVIVSNSDDALHNFHVSLNGKSISNNVQPAGSPPVQATMNESGVNQISCDVHPWMRAFIVVADHPYYTMTDSTGAYSLSNVPPGDYEVTAWRDSWVLNTAKTGGRVTGYQWAPDLMKKGTVAVQSDSAATLNFTLE